MTSDTAAEPQQRPGRARRARVIGVLAVLVVAGVVVAGMFGQPARLPVGSDELGPDPGMAVADYLARARSSLAVEPTAQRWALVSFGAEPTAQVAAELTADLRVAQVLYRAPIDRVQTPLVTVDVPADRAAVRASSGWAASKLLWTLPTGEDRGDRVTALSAQRIRGGCACVVGLVVRGTGAQLRGLADKPGVRAVEALPADAVAGRFSVTPLLPEQQDAVTPGVDDGPLPVA